MTWRHRLIARLARYLRVRVRFDEEPVPQVRGVLLRYEPTRWARGDNQ